MGVLDRRSVRLWWYAATIFVSSALLLVLEITAGRLLAPYIGVSLYTWTSIIGVILAGLSLGNWIGGIWVDRGGNERAVGITLGIGGVSSLLLLWLLTVVAGWLQGTTIGLISMSFIYVATLFFIPAALLGVVTPMLTTLALHMDSRTGHVVGRLHALAALGSIFGTFLTGYWLVQYFGTRNIVLGTGIALLLLAVPFFRRRRADMVGITLAAVLASFVTVSTGAWKSPCDRESSYFCIRVIDQSSSVPHGVARAMVLDHLIHSVSHDANPRMLIAPYADLMDELIVERLRRNGTGTPQLFFAGGGAYTQPRAIAALYPQANIVVAELDSVVTDVAKKHFFYEQGTSVIHHRDARLVLGEYPEHNFNIVVGDVFHDISLPQHLITREYAELIRSRLTPDGLYVLNLVDIFPNPRLVKAAVRTLMAVFPHVDIWLDDIPGEITRMTYVVAASSAAPSGDFIRSSDEPGRLWYRVTEPLLYTGTPLAELPVLTDDYVPVERLIAPLLLTNLGQ